MTTTAIATAPRALRLGHLVRAALAILVLTTLLGACEHPAAARGGRR
ncbi:hypothetical protein G5V59_18840 [Nocardioides sp. W3-2-3]|nr:hypothetical protein [Nocardioides convexus]NHA01218.1 hypothetical protein [Nocardioides convexus]